MSKVAGGLAERIETVRERIESAELRTGVRGGSVALVAVTKQIPADVINEAVALGMVHLGENRVQEWQSKAPEVEGKVLWNIIGQLQRNKVKYVIGSVSCIQSLDRFSLAQEIQRQAEAKGIAVRALLEVNISGEKAKAGVAVSEAKGLLERIAESCPHVSVEGLMGIAPDVGADGARPYFEKLKRLFDEFSAIRADNVRMCTLSMGMTGDFEAAIMEGSNMVRIGSALFGRR